MSAPVRCVRGPARAGKLASVCEGAEVPELDLFAAGGQAVDGTRRTANPTPHPGSPLRRSCLALRSAVSGGHDRLDPSHGGRRASLDGEVR